MLHKIVMLENTCSNICSICNIKHLHKLVKLQQKSCRKVPNLIFYPLSQIEDLGVYELATTAISYCYNHSGARTDQTELYITDTYY